MGSRRLSAQEREFFTRYLASLKAAGIPALLLRNYDEFPEAIGNDLDLFVPRSELSRATGLFTDLLAGMGGELLMQNRREYVLDLRFVFEGGVSQALHLDLYHGAFTWHGQPYLLPEKLLAGAIEHPSGFTVPRPAHEALNMVFASLLWGGFFKARYQPRIEELLAVPLEREEYDRCLAEAFGATTRLGFDPCAPTPPAPELARQAAEKMRRALKRTASQYDRLATLGRSARYWLAEIRTVLRPRGLHVAILGPDGSGKSTAIKSLEATFSRIFVDTHLHHWRPSVLPEVGVLLRKRAPRTGTVEKPHEQPPHSPAVSLLRLLYYLADYWLGYGPHILKRKAQSHLVIFDRYAADMWCDPRRYRLKLPTFAIRLLSWFTPRPDFTFVLLADAPTLAQRKGELPDEALETLLDNYRVLANSGPRCIAIDACRSAAEVTEQMEQVLRAFLLHREARSRA